MSKKIIAGIFTVLVLGCVIFFTCQGPEETTALSESVRQWIGYNGSGTAFRSDVHLVEYFIVGFAVIGFARILGWKLWTGVFAACMFGLMDEGFKVLLPTREIRMIDLISIRRSQPSILQVIQAIHSRNPIFFNYVPLYGEITLSAYRKT